MTPIRIVRAALLGSVAALLGASPALAVVPGGRSARADCYAVYDGVSATRGRFVVECTDGDPSCDTDGVCNDRCAIGVRVCVNQPGRPPCTPPAALSRLKIRPRGILPEPETLAGAACGPLGTVDVPVRVRRSGRKRPGKAKVRVTAVAADASPRRDRNRLKLLCVPRTGVCPLQSTTTTVPTASTTTTVASTSSSTTSSSSTTTIFSTSTSTSTSSSSSSSTTSPDPTTTSTTSTTTSSSSVTSSTSFLPTTTTFTLFTTTSVTIVSTTSSTFITFTTTTTTSTTSTTAAGCCGGATEHRFATGVFGGDCGDLTNVDGSKFADIGCGGLYFGGGGNSVPLPAVLPDLATSVAAITSCTGQLGTLGPTTSSDTGSLLDCTSPGCFFGGPLPLPNTNSTPTSTCLINTVATAASGAVDCAAGSSTVDVPLDTEIFLVGDSLPLVGGIQPCPLCTGGTPGVTDSGTCEGGAANGGACTPHNSGQTSAYPTSHDCPPSVGLSIGTIPIAFALSTGTVEWTATAAPNPTSGSQVRVFCGYCRDADFTGAFQEPFQQCWENGIGVGGACAQPDEACQQRNQGAYGPAGGAVKTISATGTPAGSLLDLAPHPQTLVSVFCIPPTFEPTIDAAADLPGPGTAVLQGTVQLF